MIGSSAFQQIYNILKLLWGQRAKIAKKQKYEERYGLNKIFFIFFLLFILLLSSGLLLLLGKVNNFFAMTFALVKFLHSIAFSPTNMLSQLIANLLFKLVMLIDWIGIDLFQVIHLLEKESIQWTESEAEPGTISIRLDQIDHSKLSFAKKFKDIQV